MKSIVIVLLVASAIPAWAWDPAPIYYIHHPTAAEAAAEKAAEKAGAAANLIDRQKYFVPRDPWRAIGFEARTPIVGYSSITMSTNYAKGSDWVQFYGTVSEIRPDGVMISGWFGPPLDFENGHPNILFKVVGFPKAYTVSVGQNLLPDAKLCAHVARGCLDYGTPAAAPKTTSPAIASVNPQK